MDNATPKRGTINILMAGVGGQGVLLASETLALAALGEGLEAKQSEVHGVAQRGGSVVSHVRIGERVYSPLVRCGDLDVLYAMERLEALRYAHYLKPGGVVVMDDRAIHPIRMPGEAEKPYPEAVAPFLREQGYEVEVIEALDAAVCLGDKRCANVVLLGALSRRLGLSDDAWRRAIDERFPSAARELNHRAFAEGRRLDGIACA